jgi:hypothetical protein
LGYLFFVFTKGAVPNYRIIRVIIDIRVLNYNEVQLILDLSLFAFLLDRLNEIQSEQSAQCDSIRILWCFFDPHRQSHSASMLINNGVVAHFDIVQLNLSVADNCRR